jgi:hypothetical protein
MDRFEEHVDKFVPQAKENPTSTKERKISTKK